MYKYLFALLVILPVWAQASLLEESKPGTTQSTKPWPPNNNIIWPPNN